VNRETGSLHRQYPWSGALRAGMSETVPPRLPWRKEWGAKEIFITENGCAGDEVIADDGNIYDTDRIMFVRAHLTQLQRAIADGVPVKGYFYWSAMDNLEWTAGFGNRFGLVYVDFKTQKRTPKQSAAWFREAAASNRVV
jgi:beta-glucosidase